MCNSENLDALHVPVHVSSFSIIQDVLQYSITGDADCRNSFYIISATGEIFLGKNLKTTNDVLFQVSHMNFHHIAFNLKP